MRRIIPLFTCEHASKRVPPSLKPLFRNKTRLLASHRAWDDGALPIARTLAKAFKTSLLEGQFSRLVIDLNRSPNHQGLFSEVTRRLPPAEQRRLLTTIHEPFRKKAFSLIERALSEKRYVYHFSIHSFTPVLNGQVRNCEIGILYDPRRPHEKHLASALRITLRKQFPNIRLRMNFPYRGTSDGHTANLRKRFNDRYYAGIELEFNQAWNDAKHPKSQKAVAAAIQESLEILADRYRQAAP